MKWEVPPRRVCESGGHRAVRVMSAFPLGLEHYERWADSFEEASSYKYQGAGSDKGGCGPPDFCVTGQRCHGLSSTGCKLCLQWQVTNSTSVVGIVHTQVSGACPACTALPAQCAYSPSWPRPIPWPAWLKQNRSSCFPPSSWPFLLQLDTL